jgi:hypothetical protein
MKQLSRWIIAVGLAIVMVDFGADKLLHAQNWIGWMPAWIDGFLGVTVARWITVIGLGELIVGLGLLIPPKHIQRIAALLASVHLVSVIIVVASISGGFVWNDQIVIRDIGLLAMGIALMFE